MFRKKEHVESVLSGSEFEWLENLKHYTLWVIGGIAGFLELARPDRMDWVVVVLLLLCVTWSVGIYAIGRTPVRFRALLFSLDVVIWTLMPMVILLIWCVFRMYPTYSIFLEYYYVYLILVFCSSAYGVWYGVERWKYKTMQFTRYANSESLSLNVLCDVYFSYKNSSRWSTGSTQIISALGVSSTIGILISHSDWKTFAPIAFLLFAVIVFPPTMFSSLVRRWYLYKHLGDFNCVLLPGRSAFERMIRP